MKVSVYFLCPIGQSWISGNIQTREYRNCFALLCKPRPTVERNGLILMVDDNRFPLDEGEEPEIRSIRFRTLGCYPLTGAVVSKASTLTEVIQEMI